MDVTKTRRYADDILVEADPLAPVHLWYMSFANPSLPEGSRFLGGLFVRAKSLGGALAKSHAFGLNPGGAVRALVVNDLSSVPEEVVGRLLSKEEVESL